MIRFRNTTEHPRNWFSRSQQWRLLLLVFSLGLVLVLISEVRKPQRWEWFWALTADRDASSAAREQVTGQKVDTRVRPTAPDNLPLDVFISPARAKPKVDVAGEYFPGVKPEWFKRVEDHTGFRREDHQAWFHLFQVLANHDSRELEQGSTGEVGFVQLFHQPEVYRGRLVTIRGAVYRVLEVRAPPNDTGVESYYQLVLRLAGGPDLPVMVYSLHLPEGFPTRKAVDEEVSITGFFFKNTAYTTGQGIHSYPTLLARTLERGGPKTAGQNAPPTTSQTAVWMALAAVGLAAAFAVVAARWVYVSSRRMASSPARRHTRSSIGPFALVILLVAGQAAAGEANRSQIGEPSHVAGPRELLAVEGVDASLLGKLADGRPLADDDEQALLKLIYSVQRFDWASIARWTRHDTPLKQLADDPDAYRGQLFALTGRVTRITRIKPPTALAERFEMEAYYRCELRAASRQTALVLTSRVPGAWQLDAPLDERASASGLFVKLGTGDAATRPLVFVARRLAWHPDKIGEMHPGQCSGVPLGMTVLGGLGMDVGLWDEVQNRQAITDRDREAFYQLLHAVERLDADDAWRLARRGLAFRKLQWRREEQAMSTRVTQLRSERDQAAKGDDRRAAAERKRTLQQAERRLAGVRHALRRAEAGRFSVAPLFNWPEEQYGRLVVLEGAARRAIEIQVGSAHDAAANRDIRDRFGIDHYYEVDIFTDDSQNNPVVFCVRHLPAGFPTGEAIDERVRLAGFFFKSWAFRSHRITAVAGEGGSTGKSRQLAPLLVARVPIWLPAPASAANPAAGAIVGGLFLLALVVIWLAIWASGRSDRRFHRQAVAKRYAPEEGTTLDDLHLGVPGQGEAGPSEIRE